MLFHFQLRPMRNIDPWHDAGGTNPHLHWFGLTDGWYWIEVGDTELFRYSEALLRWEAQRYQGERWWVRTDGLPYVDYQVARLWQDVLCTLPDVFEPVPPWLARTLGPGGTWAEWDRQAEAVLREALPREEASDLYLEAIPWLGPRTLDSLYLVSGPDIRIWSDAQDVHIWWDTRELSIVSLPAWQADLGEYKMSRQAYLEPVMDLRSNEATE